MEPFVRFQSVWEENFTAESAVFTHVAPRASLVALNVQYPGCVVRGDVGTGVIPIDHELTAEQRYGVIRANVSRLKPLQIGLAMRTYDGRCFIWEFNLRGYEITNPHEEGDARSVQYLVEHGMDFDRLPLSGIPVPKLHLMIHKSGLLLKAGLSWATFTGAYHVAYFMSVMFGELPGNVDIFMKKVCGLLGRVYDVRLLVKERGHVGALEKVAERLGVVVPPNGFGAPKLAGAGSVMALMLFEALKAGPDGNLVENRCNSLCGLQAT